MTSRVWWLLSLLLLVGLLAAPAVAEDQEDACFVWDLAQPCMAMPLQMARDTYGVIQCESRWNPLAVGRAGERGLLQLRPQHAPAMALDWLNYFDEAARLRWAVRLWVTHGWAPWSCAP